MISNSLSLVIPTLNEEKDLPLLLDSVKDLVSEIIIVDSGSTDGTLTIAKNHRARIFHLPLKSFAQTRNFGDSKAKGEWILSLEADVVITPALAEEIKTKINSDRFSSYYIPRVNRIWGELVLYADWGPKDDNHIWLYKKGIGNWVGKVHEEFQTKEKAGQTQNHLVHQNYRTVGEFIDKINTYSEFQIKKNRYFPDWWFLRDFFKRYFYKLGFLAGYRGLFLSYLQAVYYLTLSVKRYTKSD